MTPALEESQRLLRSARRDRDTFLLLVALPQASMAALGFHAQQAVEKALKAVAVSAGVETRRTHDLAALSQSLLEAGCRLPFSLDEVRELNPFAVEFRYDDEFDTVLSRDDLTRRLERVLTWAEAEVLPNGTGSG